MKTLKKNFLLVVTLFILIGIAVFTLKTATAEKGTFLSLPESFCVNINGSGNYVRLYYDENHSSDTWYLFLPSNTDRNRSSVEFTGCEKIIFEDINGNKYSQENGKSLAEGIEPFESYYMEFCDKDGNEIERRIFQYMKSENVASLFVETESGTMEAINSDKANDERGSISLFGEDGELEYRGDLESFKGRGNTSWDLDKKPYRFKLNENISLFGLKSSRIWVLLANCLDKTNIRNKTANGFARAMGLNGTTSSKYVDLYLNGNYNGLYELSEKIQLSSGSVDLEDLDYKNEKLNSRAASSYPKAVVNEDGSGERVGFKLDRNPEDISGGYLIEKNYLERYDASPSRFTTASGEKYCVRSPEIASVKEVEYIAGLMDEIEKRAKTGGNVAELIDLKSFADKYLLEEFVDNEASGATSSFFYKNSDKKDPYLYAGPPWDYDKSLGYLLPGEKDDKTRLTYLTNHGNGTRLFYNLFMNCSDFREMVYKEYKELMEPVLSEYIANEGWKNNEYSGIDDRMDMMRWTSTPESTAEEIEKIGEFVKLRKELFDRIFKKGEKLCTVHFVGDFANRDPYYGYVSGSALGELPDIKQKDGKTAIWVNSETGEELSETTLVTEEYIEAVVKYK